LLKNTFDRKRISAKPSPNPKAQQRYRTDDIFRESVQVPLDR